MTRNAVFTVTVAMLACSGASLAQEKKSALSDVITEVTVTATKRETTLSDTPLPISAVTSDVLSKMGAAGFEDYFSSVPSLAMIDIGPGQKRYMMRGVQGPGEAQVGLYYDEIPVTGPPGENNDAGSKQPDIKMWDVERVEVLRGPQGTLYGNGSMSGTIRVIAKQPDATKSEFALSSLLSNTAGGGMNYELRGMANLPLVDDKLALRLTGYTVDYDGFIDNVSLGTSRVNTEKTYGGRASLLWNIDDVSKLTATAYYQDMETGGAFEFNRAITTSDTDLKSDRFLPQPYLDEIKLFNLTYDRNFGWGDLVVSLSRYDRKVQDERDTSPDTSQAVADDMGESELCSIRSKQYCSQAFLDALVGLVPVGLRFNGGVKSTSLEARLVSNADSAFRWTTGVFYQDRESLFRNAFGRREPSNPGVMQALLFSRENIRTTKQSALFAEVEYDLTDRLTWIGGLRWSKYETEEKQWTLWSNFPPFGPPILSPVFRGDLDSSETNLVPKLSFSYELSDDANAYILYSEGFRAGGPNAPGGDQDPPPYKSDSTKNYELGLKTTWLDGAATLNVALYRILWNDIQVVVDDITGSFDFITNFGKAAINGFELDGSYRVPGTGLSFAAQLSLTDSGLVGEQPDVIMINVGGVPTAVAVSDPGQEGDPIPDVPKWSAYLSVNYERPLNQYWDMYAYLDWQFTDGSRTTFSEDSIAFAKRRPYNTTNVRFGLSNESLELSLFVKNLTNEITDQGIHVAEMDVPFTITTRPRTVGLEATWKF